MKSIYVQNRIGETIREREKKGFQFKPSNVFYKDLGIPKRRFGQYIRNEKQPNLEELTRIAICFNVNPKDLF